MTENGDSLGGQGGCVTRSELVMTRRAIRSDWPIPADARGQIVCEMVRIISGSASDRERIGAARVLIAADSVNARREALDLQAELQTPPVKNAAERRVLILPSNGRESEAIQQAYASFDAMEPEYREWKRKRQLESVLGRSVDVGRNGFKSEILGHKTSADD